MSQALLIPGIGRLNLQRLLFGANEVGGIWDWSDRSTMFQDINGTQPITASGQTRALHLDKSKGLVRGSELVTNGGLDSSANWVDASDGTATVVISGGSAVFTSTTGSTARLTQNIIGTGNRWYEIKFDLLAHTSGNINIRLHTAGSQALLSSPSPGSFAVKFFAATVSQLQIISTGNAGFTIDNISVRELPGNHRYQPNLSNRPQYIEDETGHYGLYDGVDDWDETNAVDFTGTDKMTVWWGGRKLSDATNQAIIELSSSYTGNAGSFAFFTGTPTAPSNQVHFASRGSASATTAQAAVSTGFNSPVSQVITGTADISGPLTAIRINGSPSGTNGTATQGTGNFGNHKLFFGRRAGTSFPANIREYMTIIRGAQTPTPIIERVEREVRRKIKGLTF